MQGLEAIGWLKRIAQFRLSPRSSSLSSGLIWLDDHEFYAKVKIGRQRHLFRHVRALTPFPRQGDESKYRDVLKTSRMRWGKNRKDVDAGILRLLKRGLD